MDAAMREYFDQRVSLRQPGAEVLEAIVAAIIRPAGLGFAYDGVGTFDAGETFRRRRGNCLSFALLVTAVARHYGFKTTFQNVDRTGQWDRVGDIITTVQHVNVRVETLSEIYVLDLRPDLVPVAERQTATTVADARLFALFYNDVGIGHLMQGRTAEARRALELATQIDPRCASIWANRATLHARFGELTLARSAYERSLQLDRQGLNALVGFVSVLKQLGTPGDLRLAGELERRAQQVQDRNPYYHQHLAQLAQEKGDWQGADKHLRRAIALKEDAPEFFEQWIVTLQHLGREEAAQRATTRLAKLRQRLAERPARIMP
jgi:Tfp pilus assembly protein PilF